jgi:hypothetical protein
MKSAVTSLTVVFCCVVFTACGATRKSSSSSSHTSSARVAIVGAPAGAGTAGSVNGLQGDEDDDDGPGESRTMNSNRPFDSDVDNDNDVEDNAGKGYFDQDDVVVQDYGHAAVGNERQTLVDAVERYDAAAKRGDGKAACAMIESAFESSIVEDYGRSPGPAYLRGNTCPVVMSRLFAYERARYLAAVKVVDVRVEGNQALVLIGSKAVPASYVRLRHEARGWKIDELVATPLP